MKALKIILIVLVVLAALVFIPPIFLEKTYSVEKEVTINQPKAVVFEYIKYLKNQDNYSVWANMDPDMDKVFEGIDGTIGFISGWESDNKDVGRGEQEIIAISDGERIDLELRFYEPFETTDNAFMTTESVNDSVSIVKWGFSGKMDYPMNLMLLFMDMEEMLGSQLQEGLVMLKEIQEAV